MSMKGRLTTQLIRSLREHPEDWHFGEAWARNDHLKIRVYKRKGAPFIDIWWKDQEVVKDWRNLLAYFVPWRCRMIHAMRRAEKIADQTRLSLAIDDTFETPTKTSLEDALALMRNYVNELNHINIRM